MNLKQSELDNISKEELRTHIIGFPTDTVYGIGAILDDEVGIEKIYELKHRDYSKPLAILAPNIQEVLKYVVAPSDKVLELMKKYWPGALTIVFNKNSFVSDHIVRGKQTIGFRIPDSSIALKILNKYGALATTSVNLSGEPPLNNYKDINLHFGSLIDYLIDEDTISSDVSSTVIDITTDEIKVLRQGSIKVQ